MRKRWVVTVAWACAVLAVSASAVLAQNKDPRFGRWKLKQDPPALNIMTYEPFGQKGMKVTVESTSADGRKTSWWYTTEFDGTDMPVTGQENATTSVRRIDERTNEIVNKRNGVVTQILTNTLAPDGNSIGVMYFRMDPQGKTNNITFAMYERIP